MIHERLDLNAWVKQFPLAGIKKSDDVTNTLTGPLPIAYVEQIRAKVRKAGANLGKPTPVDLCVWKLGDARRRDVTKIGGVPYWPADEEWPTNLDDVPYTFVAQFCFADSRDILPRLPGDILSILAAESDYSRIEFRWFQLGSPDLLPPKKMPAPRRWPIQPCHAVLHRTADYPDADDELFEQYPYPMSSWATTLGGCSKFGGVWVPHGELPDLDDCDDPDTRAEIEEAYEREEKREQTFICRLGSVEATERQPFLNVERRKDVAKVGSAKLLMIADVGGYDFFYDGETTEGDWYS